ncbi:MAG: ribosomal RNA small subunit methyltransferase A [Fimbriimonadaceae bacterium]|nr:ribosomal RNA small subunit methyltransferase A [Fimbriimonadaceae bacterium]
MLTMEPDPFAGIVVRCLLLKGRHASVSMNLCSVPDLRDLLLRHGLSPTKRWGQHFLVSERVVSSILGSVPPCTQSILEVGPGPGVLTAELSSHYEVIAIEIDPIAVSALSESAPRAKVIMGDALDTDLAAVLEELPEPRIIVSNMPYNITGPLLTSFTARRKQAAGMIVMMQKEVAQRILAQPGDREMGSLSVMLQSRFEISKVIDAPASAFYPPPKVDSCVLRLVPIQTGWADAFDQFHERIVRQGFAQPRKTLANNLKVHSFDPTEEGWSPTIRPHQLTIANWETLARALELRTSQ